MAKIAIIDDDINLAILYKKKLEEAGHKAFIFNDNEAVAKIRETKPNLVLLDVLMPEVNGLDILRELKADAEVSAIPVVLLTNVAESDTISQGLKLGAYGYLLKSETTPAMVLNRVNMTLDENNPLA